MLKGKSFLAIVPARAGSKRLPGKNTLSLSGKPLVTWSITAAQNSKYIDDILVSTDSLDVVEAAKACQVQVPFMRPPELSNDTASSTDVIRHALQFYKNEKSQEFDFLVLLQPTSPLRTAEDIDKAIELLMAKNAAAVVSVCPMDHSPLWANTLPPDHSLAGFLREEVKGVRSQDLPTYYRINGAIYICDTNRFLAEGSLFLKDSIYAYPMPIESSTDIDTAEDLALAEFFISRKSRQ